MPGAAIDKPRMSVMTGSNSRSKNAGAKEHSGAIDRSADLSRRSRKEQLRFLIWEALASKIRITLI